MRVVRNLGPIIVSVILLICFSIYLVKLASVKSDEEIRDACITFLESNEIEYDAAAIENNIMVDRSFHSVVLRDKKLDIRIRNTGFVEIRVDPVTLDIEYMGSVFTHITIPSSYYIYSSYAVNLLFIAIGLNIVRSRLQSKESGIVIKLMYAGFYSLLVLGETISYIVAIIAILIVGFSMSIYDNLFG